MFNKLIINSFLIQILILFETNRFTESAIMGADRSSHMTLTQFTAPANPDHCYRPMKCRPLNTSQCLDVTLPYKYTTSNVWDSQSLGEIHDYLSRWKGLRSIPQCWKALQSVLCASFFPRCDNESSRVSLPTHEMCRLTRQPCRLIEQHFHWPEFLRCDNETLFPNKCKNDYTDLKFNTSGIGAKCSTPLVSTDDQNIWYPGIESCALQCHNPLYTTEAHKKVSAFVSHGAGISLFATLFSVSTFIIDWRSSNRYPAVIIFYLNMCLLIANMGWLFQSVLSKGHTEIVCRPDNTSRYGEPGNSVDNFYCLTTFLLIYYFSMAAMVWFVNLSYAWDLSFQKSGASRRDAVNAKVAYFHLSAWSVPLMLTITIVALGEVDGDSLRGICFVGVLKPVMRICFVLIPTTVSLLIGCYYMFKAMITLINVKLMNKSTNNSNRNRSKKIEHMIIRIGLFVTFAVISVIMTYISHIYEFSHLSHWKKSLNDYIICSLNMTSALYPDTSLASDEVQSCKLVDRPNLMYTYLQLSAVFGAGICASSWVWTANSLAGWKRFIIRHLKPDHNEPIRLKRHEMISKVFGRRHQLTQGCYSPSFHSMHSDPVAMNLNSAVSQDLTASWADALPKFMYRRGAIVANNNDMNGTQNTHYLPNFVGTRHSSNSDISQQRSYDSYRRSLDSQYSLEQLEMVAIDRHQRRKTKREREKLLKAYKRAKPYHLSSVRRGSDTSGSVISAALAARGLTKGSKSECKSTSTGDLIQLGTNQIPQIIANPYMTPIASPSTLSMTVPKQFIPQAVIPRVRAQKPNISNFTFTHGMSEQSSHLTNPLEEKRRPDSCAHSYIDHNSAHVIQGLRVTPNGTQIQHQNINNNSNLQFTAPANYGMSYAMNGMTNGLNSGLNNGLNYIPNPQSLNYFQPMNTFYGNLLVNSQTQSYPNFMAPAYPTTPLPGIPFANTQYPQYLPGQYPPISSQPQHCTNLQELQALMREREAYLQLIMATDSTSEMGSENILSIQLSDSEGLYSPDILSGNEDLITTQQLVDQHIQRVEASVEANGADIDAVNSGGIVGALGGGCIDDEFEIQSKTSNKTSKSESKRKKKKSSKKHNKTNGFVNNCNNNNHPLNTPLNNTQESEEQKPLMSDLNTNEEIKS